MRDLLSTASAEYASLLRHVEAMHPQLLKLGEMMLRCWETRGKVLLCGNGGSAADAMHLAEELSIRFHKNRRALAAIALLDPTVLTCAGNDFGFENVFSRQVEALGNAGDVLVVFTTSGNSVSVLNAIDSGKRQGMTTVAFIGKDGGAAKGRCDVEFLVPSPNTARIQEAHQLLYHVLCEWVDTKVD